MQMRSDLVFTSKLQSVTRTDECHHHQ